MKILAEHGIDILCKDTKLSNALHNAAIFDYQNVVDMLCKSNFPLDEVNYKNFTAVSLAAKKGHLEVLSILREQGADINLPDNNGIGPLYLSILHDKIECAEFLIEKGAFFYYDDDDRRDFSPIFLAIRKEHTHLLEVLCDHGANLAVKDNEGMTPLMYASSKGRDEIVNYLTLRTKDLNEEDKNSLTLLIQYLYKEDFKMARRILVRGANIDYVNSNGNTALHLCVENGLDSAVTFLLKKGANPHIMDLRGEDSCDKAKKNQMALRIFSFNMCNLRLRVEPVLPVKETKKYEMTQS